MAARHCGKRGKMRDWLESPPLWLSFGIILTSIIWFIIVISPLQETIRTLTVERDSLYRVINPRWDFERLLKKDNLNSEEMDTLMYYGNLLKAEIWRRRTKIDFDFPDTLIHKPMKRKE